MDKNTFASVERYQMLEYVMRSFGVEVNGLAPVTPLDRRSANKLGNFLDTFNNAVSQIDSMVALNHVLRDKVLLDVQQGRMLRTEVDFDVTLFAGMLRERYERKVADELDGRFSDRVVCSVLGYVRKRISDAAGPSK